MPVEPAHALLKSRHSQDILAKEKQILAASAGNQLTKGAVKLYLFFPALIVGYLGRFHWIALKSHVEGPRVVGRPFIQRFSVGVVVRDLDLEKG